MKTIDTTRYFIIKEVKKTTSQLMEECRKLFKIYSYYDDAILDKDFPVPKKLTVRYFKKTVEADGDLANKSADDLKKEGIEGITLRERVLMEIQYFKETGKHLDVENVTLCSGSRGSGGGVPRVNWDAGSRKVYF